MIEKKREIIVKELNNVSESVLDGILAIIEKSKETDKEDVESVINVLIEKGILIPPIGQKRSKMRRTPVKGKGKPLSEMIVEDRR